MTSADPLADVDPRLICEAFRRARARRRDAEIDSDTLLSAIIAAARLGARDLFTLVAAGDRAGPRTPA